MEKKHFYVGTTWAIENFPSSLTNLLTYYTYHELYPGYKIQGRRNVKMFGEDKPYLCGGHNMPPPTQIEIGFANLLKMARTR